MSRRQFLITGSVTIFLLVAAVVLSFFGYPSRNPATNNSVATSTQVVATTTSQLSLQAEYHVNLPNGIMLVDSEGRRTGKVPATGMIYREIPGVHYGEDCLSKTNCAGELFFSPPEKGEYTLYILGGSTGAFGLSAWDNQGPPQTIRGDIQPGSMKVYTLNFTPATVASSTVVSLQGSVSSTASITSAPPHNLPLPPVPTPTVRISPPPTPPLYPVIPPNPPPFIPATSTPASATSTHASSTP